MAQPGSTIGELVVIALKAENLPRCTPTGKQDPFCIFKLGSAAKKTKTDQNGGQTPIWDDQINLPVPAGANRLFVQIFNRQASNENLIAEGHVDLYEVLRKGEHDGFFPLGMNGKKAGQIYLELTYYAGQAQMQQQPQYPAPHIRQYANRPPPPSSYPPMNRPAQPRPYPVHNRPPPPMNHIHPPARPMPPPLNQPVRYSSTPVSQPPVISSPYQPTPTNVIPSPYQAPRPPVNGYPPRPVYSQPYASPPPLQHHHSFHGGPPPQRPFHSRPPPPQQHQSFSRPHSLPPHQTYPNRPYPQQQHPPPPSGYSPY